MIKHFRNYFIFYFKDIYSNINNLLLNSLAVTKPSDQYKNGFIVIIDNEDDCFMFIKKL